MNLNLSKTFQTKHIFKKENFIKAGIAIVLLFLTHFIATIISKTIVNLMIHKSVKHQSNHESNKDGKPDLDGKKRSLAFSMLGNIIYWTIFIVALLMVPTFLGIETTALIAILGSVLFAVGLGLQGTLSDLAIGVMLLGAGTFKLKDYIEIPEIDLRGTVNNFGILYTEIVDDDTGILVTVPNRKLYENAIHNNSLSTQSIAFFEIAISNTNKNVGPVLQRLRERLQEFPRILKIEGFNVTCNVNRISEFATIIEVRLALRKEDYQISGTLNYQGEIMTFIRKELEDMNVQFPTRSEPSSTSQQIVYK